MKLEHEDAPPQKKSWINDIREWTDLTEYVYKKTQRRKVSSYLTSTYIKNAAEKCVFKIKIEKFTNSFPDKKRRCFRRALLSQIKLNLCHGVQESKMSLSAADFSRRPKRVYLTIRHNEAAWQHVAHSRTCNSQRPVTPMTAYFTTKQKKIICNQITKSLSVQRKPRHATNVLTHDHRRSQDFVWGCTFLPEKLTTFF